jgi:hypothetical protein
MTTTKRMHQVIADVAAKHSVAVQQVTSVKHASKNVLAALVEISKTLHAPPYEYSMARIAEALHRDRSTISYHVHKSDVVNEKLRWHRPRVWHLNCGCRWCTLVHKPNRRESARIAAGVRRATVVKKRGLIRYAGCEW